MYYSMAVSSQGGLGAILFREYRLYHAHNIAGVAAGTLLNVAGLIAITQLGLDEEENNDSEDKDDNYHEDTDVDSDERDSK